MLRRFFGLQRGALAVVIVAMASGALAQDSDPTAQRQLGEAMIFGSGGVVQDTAGGIRLLGRVAEAGDAEAAATLGKILLDGYYVPAEPARAISLLEDAAAAGLARAQRILGIALLWGSSVDADPKRAQGLLEQAADAGDLEAMRVLGEQLVGGWVLPQDSAAGRALLEKAIAAGDHESGIVLGGFLLYGDALPTDPQVALALFERAAAVGDGKGLEVYGEWLMWSQDNPSEAEALLRRAGELGRGRAWTVLAEGAMHGYLPPNSRAKFDAFADRARAAGEERIALLEAERRMWGITLPASGPETIAVLEQAANDGNGMAVKYLVGLVRDGNQFNINSQPDLARRYIDTYGAVLEPLERERLSLSVEVARATEIFEFSEISQALEGRPDLMSADFAKDLFSANPNLAVYLLQSDMKARGEYAGTLDGIAARGTLASLVRVCKAEIGTDLCVHSPLHPDVIGPLLLR